MPDNHKDPTIIQQIALKRHPGRMSVSFNPPRENPSMVWRSCPVRSCPRTCGVGGIAGESMVVYNSQLRNMLSNPVRACFRKLAGLLKSQSLVSIRIENNPARSAKRPPHEKLAAAARRLGALRIYGNRRRRPCHRLGGMAAESTR